MSRGLSRIAVFAVALIGCSGDPWKMKDAPKRAPDIQFRAGIDVGADYFVWKCEGGTRIAIYRQTSWFWVGAPQMAKGPCDTPFPFESAISFENRRELPDGSRWPGTPRRGNDDLGISDAGTD